MSSSPHSIDLVVPVVPTDHVLGPEHAGVTVIEYGDFECPICKQAAPAVKMLLHTFEARVRFIYRHFPQEQAHPHALLAAEASECAGAQGKFWEMHDLLFQHQDHLELKHLRQHAESLGIDMARFTAELDDEVYRQRIREQMEGGRRSHVRGSPGFFVNGVTTDVSFGLRELFNAVSEALKRGQRGS